MASGLTFQIINDSGQSDSDVYLLLTGESIGFPSLTPAQVTPAIVSLPQAKGASASSSALNALGTTETFVSPLTGAKLPIYSFNLDTIVSGRLLISFGTAITYSDGTAPTATQENFRWDKMEFGYPGSGADLTSLDFFGIPLQFDFIDASGTILETATFYSSTTTLLSTLSTLSSSMGTAFQPPLQGSTVDLSNFYRVLGPGTIASNNGSPAPYPSFSDYLTALATSGQSFTVTGTAGVGSPAPADNAVTYTYSGSFASDNANGFTLTLTGTTSGYPYGLYTDSKGNTTDQALPTNLTVTVALPAGSFDTNIYAAPADAFTVALSSSSQSPTGLPTDWANYVPNSAYATIAGDILAGLNFGYPGGTFGTDSSTWYNSPPPTPYPFAEARASNDGYYNPYAAVFYNFSDSYGFPFSDRGGRPSPYIPQPSTATILRVTILPDVRLDQPQGLALTNPSSGNWTLSWSAVAPPAGFTVTSYDVAVSPPATPATTSVTSCTFTDLTPGLAYTFTVTAIGTGPTSQPVQSYPATLSAGAGGTWTAPTGSLPFQITLNWSANVSGVMPSTYTLSIGGQTYQPNNAPLPVTINGVNGLNYVPITISAPDSAGKSTVIYQSVYTIDLSATAGTPGAYSLNGTPTLAGNSQPLTTAWSAQSPKQLSIGTPFAPIAGKLAGPVAFPAS